MYKYTRILYFKRGSKALVLLVVKLKSHANRYIDIFFHLNVHVKSVPISIDTNNQGCHHQWVENK